jgi:hypothetical protein
MIIFILLSRLPNRTHDIFHEPPHRPEYRMPSHYPEIWSNALLVSMARISPPFLTFGSQNECTIFILLEGMERIRDSVSSSLFAHAHNHFVHHRQNRTDGFHHG